MSHPSHEPSTFQSNEGWKRAVTDFSNQSHALTNAMLIITLTLLIANMSWSSGGSLEGVIL